MCFRVLALASFMLNLVAIWFNILFMSKIIVIIFTFIHQKAGNNNREAKKTNAQKNQT